MRRFVAVAGVLFLLHTLEEVSLNFWQSDTFSLATARAIGESPATAYWIGQVLLYALLAFLLLAPASRSKNWLYVLLGVLMLLESVHVFVSLQSLHYEPGLITGIALILYGLFFLTVLKKNRIKHV